MILIKTCFPDTVVTHCCHPQLLTYVQCIAEGYCNYRVTWGLGNTTVTIAMDMPFSSLKSYAPDMLSQMVTVYTTMQISKNGFGFGRVLSYTAELTRYQLSIGNLNGLSYNQAPGVPVLTAILNGVHSLSHVRNIYDISTMLQDGMRGRNSTMSQPAQVGACAGAAHAGQTMSIPGPSLGCAISRGFCDEAQNGISGQLHQPLTVNLCTSILEDAMQRCGATWASEFEHSYPICQAAVLLEAQCKFIADQQAGAVFHCAALQANDGSSLPFCNVSPSVVLPGGTPPGLLTPAQPEKCSMSTSSSYLCEDFCNRYHLSVNVTEVSAGCCCSSLETCSSCGCRPDVCCPPSLASPAPSELTQPPPPSPPAGMVLTAACSLLWTCHML